MIQFNVQLVNGIPVYSLTGHFIGGEEPTALYDNLEETLRDQHIGCVIISVQDLDRLDAMTLHVLVRMLMIASDSGTKLALVNVSDQLQEFLRISRLESIFAVCKSPDEAIADNAAP